MDEYKIQRIIDEEFRGPSRFCLNDDFAERTSRKIFRRAAMKENTRDFFIISCSTIGLTGLTFLVVILSDIKFDTHFLI